MAKIADKLDNINVTLEKILKVMDKPKNPVLTGFEIAGMVASILGIIALVDIIFKWIKEGLW